MEAARFCSICGVQSNQGPTPVRMLGSVCFACAVARLRRLLLETVIVAAVIAGAIVLDRRFRHRAEVTLIGDSIPSAQTRPLAHASPLLKTSPLAEASPSVQPSPSAQASSNFARDEQIRNPESPVTTNAVKTNSTNAGETSSSAPRAAIVKPPGVPFGICGAPTKSGKPCQRKVKDGGYCWQHRYLLSNPG